MLAIARVHSHKLLVSCVILLFVVAGSLQTRSGMAANLAATAAPTEGDVAFTLQAPAYSLQSDAQGVTQIVLQSDQERYAVTNPAGQPLLPHRSYTLALPPDADIKSVELWIDSVQEERLPGAFSLALAQPAGLECPGDGSAADQVCAAEAAQPQYWLRPTPAKQSLALSAVTGYNAAGSVGLLPSSQLRKWRMVPVEFTPFQYDAATHELWLVRSVQGHIHFKHDPASINPVMLSDATMDDAAARLLDNYDQALPQYEAARQAHPLTSPEDTYHDYVIITTSNIVNHSVLNDFATFLDDHGHNVAVVTTDQINANAHGDALADKIRQWLQANATGWHIRYVLLVGDPMIDNASESQADEVPMKATYPNFYSYLIPNEYDPVYTDAYFSNLSGDWDPNHDFYYGEGYGQNTDGDVGPGGLSFNPEVYVGRIPVENSDYNALNGILIKTMGFESRTVREDWQNKALLAMSFVSTNEDEADLGALLNANVLAPKGIYATQQYMHEPASGGCHDDQISIYPSNEYLTDNVVSYYWSQVPSGLVVWSGHGSSYATGIGYGWDGNDCWSGNLFSADQVNTLNDAKPAFVFEDSCSNGSPYDPNNVAYALLRNGAISTVAASYFTEHDPNADAAAALSGNWTDGAGIAYHYIQYLSWGMTTSEALGLERIMQFPQTNFELQTMLGFNVDGDPAAVYRVSTYDPPIAPIALTVNLTFSQGLSQFTLNWIDISPNEEYFKIYIHALDGTLDMVQNAARNATTWTFNNLPCGKTYQFSVTAVNYIAESAHSNPVTQEGYPCAPQPPTNVTASLSGNDIIINWDAPAATVNGYYVYRQVKMGSRYFIPVLVGTVTGGATTITDSDVSCGQTILYYVIAYNDMGESDPSPDITVYSQTCPPEAPSNLNSTSGQTSITLNWQDDNSSNEDGFEVYRRPHLGFQWFLLASLPAGTNQYVDDNLVCSSSDLDYEIRAYNAGGESWSGVIDNKTLACSPPAAPDGLVIDSDNLTRTSLQLIWNDHSNNEDGFKIQQYNNNTVQWDTVATTQPNITDFQVTGLKCKTLYDFRVDAFNAYGDVLSNEASGWTADCSGPNTPINLTAQGVSGSEIDLNWEQGGTVVPDGYHVARFTPGSKHPWTVIGTSTTTSYHDTDVVCGTVYTYKVNAYKASAFNSPYTEVVSAATWVCPPPAPTHVRVQTVSQKALRIVWYASPGDSYFNGFDIYRTRNPLQPFSAWAHVVTITDGTQRSYLDNHLLCDTAYTYHISAYNDGGSSDFSPSDSGQTLPCSPDAPTNLVKADNTRTTIDLTWSEASSDVTGYRLEGSPDGTSGWAEINTSTTNTPSYTDKGLTCGTPYYYRVFAYNTGGKSTRSNILATSTVACIPVLSAKSGSQGLVTLSWTDAGHTASEYKLQRSPDGTPPWTNLFPSDTITASPQRDLDAPCNATPNYRISALSLGGNSPWSAPIQVSTVCKPTTDMTLTVAHSGLRSAHLTWTATAGGQANFRIERMIKGLNYDWIVLATVNPSALAYDDLNIPDRTAFLYRIVAVNPAGQISSNLALLKAQYVQFLPAVRKK